MKVIHLFIISLSLCTSLHATTVYYWRVWCNTENNWVYGWSETEPVICPNTTGPAHSINTSSISEFGELSDTLIRIQEESIPTGHHYKAETLKLNAATGPDVNTQFQLSWPFPISLVSLNFVSTSEHEGDCITMELPSNLLIGALTQNISINDTIINVTQDVTDNVDLGYYLTLNDGTNSESLGRILTIDKINLTVTMENAATTAYAAVTPTLIYLTAYGLKEYEIGAPAHRYFGNDFISSTHVPTNLVGIISYLNRSSTAKNLVLEYEYMY